jgi:opacity protein-like surface antigen
MKPWLVLAVALQAAAPLLAQTPPPPAQDSLIPGKKFELSISGGYHSYSSDNQSTSSVFLVSPRLGYFVYKGLEVEPELSAMFGSGGDPAYAFNGNLAYNFHAQGRALLFLLAGYGVANGIPVSGIIAAPINGLTLGVLNLGGGLKVFFSDDVAVRVEGRYQHFTGSREIAGYWLDAVPVNQTVSYDVRLFSVEFGLTVFL